MMKFILRDFQIAILLFFAICGTIQAQDIEVTEWKTLEGHIGPVLSIVFSPDGQILASGGVDKFIKLWSVETGIEIKTMQGHRNWVRSLSFSPDGNILASASEDRTIKLWSTAAGTEMKTIQGHNYFISLISFSPDGALLASGSGDETIKIWSTVSGKMIVTLKGHSGAVNSVAFNPDGTVLASGSSDRTIKLWYINTGMEIREIKGHSGSVISVAFNPDGTVLASSSSDGTIKLWSPETGREIRTFKGHSAKVNSISFSPDGKILASGSSDRTIKLWSLETGKEIKTLEVHADRVYSVSFSPDGTLLASGGVDGKIKILKIDYTNQVPILVKKKEGKEDLKSPVITILEPTITRGMKKRTSEKKITVRGKAADESGIYEVSVNGVDAQLSADGGFWAEVRLRIGGNILEVIAEDTKGNRATKRFTVVREASTMPVPAVVAKSEEFKFGDYHALIVAVQNYTYKSVTDLNYPIQDAQQVMNMLIDNYTFERRNVHFLENPDRSTILKKFTELRSKLTENDNLLIFYAGHGYWDEDERQGYWLPKNADWNDRSDWLSNSVLRDKIRALKTKHTLLISDACFSGGIFKVREAFIKPDMSIQKIYEMPSRKALTSGALLTVPDKSVFVEYLVKRLKNNQEKYLYSEKLYVNMKDAVINNSPTNQTPQFGVIGSTGDEGGDFVFVRR